MKLLITVLVLCAGAQAQSTTRELFKWLQVATPGAAIPARNVAAIRHANTALGFLLGFYVGVCSMEETECKPATGFIMRDVFVRYVEEHTDELDRPINLVVLSAFEQAHIVTGVEHARPIETQ